MTYITGIKFPCPGCSRLLAFAAATTERLICPRCRERIERKALLHQPCQVAAMPEDLSLIQLGTGGMAGIDRFEVTGRLRLQLADGYLNVWTLHLENGQLRYLAESFGAYAFCEALQVPVLHERPATSAVGGELDLSPLQGYRIDHRQACLYADQLGELPDFGRALPQGAYLEMNGEAGACAYLWQYDEEQAILLLGHYQDFSFFSFVNLRSSHEWE